jgi:hypothetical protein
MEFYFPLRPLILVFTFLTFVSFGYPALSKAVLEYPQAKVKDLLKKVRKEKKLCATANTWKPNVCRNQKLLLAMEGLLESYLQVQQRAETDTLKKKTADDQNAYFVKQEEILKNSLKSLSTKSNYATSKQCFKPALLKQLMIDQGITENGNSIYSKHPIPGGEGVCWSNSKKKKEATVSLCNYPLALYLETRGGKTAIPTKRQREYLFSLNGCDLLSIHFSDVDQHGTERETFISYDQCMTQWNKRTADAAMAPAEISRMEDTIAFCFREHLLPPRNGKNGHNNPILRHPADLELPPRPKS